jgi:hypothetical protein
MTQRKRPTLKPGDVCKIAKKHRRRFIERNASLVVLRVVHGDGSDRDSMVECSVSIPSRFGRGGFRKPYKHKFHRDRLWFTGHNIHCDERPKVKMPDVLAEPVEKTNTKNSYSNTRGPHKCHCSDESFARNGCICNGL